MKKIFYNFLGLIISGILAYGLSFYWLLHGFTLSIVKNIDIQICFLAFFLVMIYLLMMFFLFRLIKDVEDIIQPK